MKSEQSRTRRAGRPLSFDRERALRQAMLTFWRHGYEGSSVAALTGAMGITPPSLYAAFGDKRALFLEAARLYMGPPEALAAQLAAAPSALHAAREILRGSAIVYTGDETPHGCLLASAAASVSPGSEDVQREVSAMRDTTRELLRERIARDIARGWLATQADATTLADLVMAVMQGMAVLARDGVSREALLSLCEQSLLGWPVSSSHPALA